MTEQDKAQVKFIFDTLEAAGVAIMTFAAIMKISRTTLHNWKKGNNITDNLRLSLAYNVARRLSEAVKQGKLPVVFDPKMRASERVEQVKTIMKSVAL